MIGVLFLSLFPEKEHNYTEVIQLRKIKSTTSLLLFLCVLTGCAPPVSTTTPATQAAVAGPGQAVVYLAGGCFWGVEEYFQRIKGVVNAVSGYANGKTDNPLYAGISETDHAETVKVIYDTHRVNLAEILTHYFRIIDPTTLNRQGNDEGRQYRTGIYYETDTVRDLAASVMAEEAKKYDQPLVVELEPLVGFYPAEDYHQDYLVKNPNGYCHVDLELAEVPLADPFQYPRPDQKTLQETLSDLSYRVVEEGATEAAFSSPLEKVDSPGIYVDIATKQPLFSSLAKFDSGSGWPSFTAPIMSGSILEVEDKSSSLERIEVRSSSGSHLGHVFSDGPKDMGGLRYCVNGAALRFIPLEEMAKENYSEFLIYVAKP